MPEQERILQKIFGSTGGTSEFGQFGSNQASPPGTTTKDLDLIQSLSNFLRGWYGATASAAEPPRIQDMNSLFLLITSQLSYMFQNGIPEYLETEEYYPGKAICQNNGVIWALNSLSDSPTIGIEPSYGISDWIPISIHSVSTISELREIEGAFDGQRIEVFGYYNINDGGGGPVRYWDSGSTEDDNNGSVIKPNSVDSSDPGRWMWINDFTSLSVRCFGASPSISDNTIFLQNALDFVGEYADPEDDWGFEIVIDGIFTSDALFVKNSNTIIAGPGKIDFSLVDGEYGLYIGPDPLNVYPGPFKTRIYKRLELTDSNGGSLATLGIFCGIEGQSPRDTTGYVYLQDIEIGNAGSSSYAIIIDSPSHITAQRGSFGPIKITGSSSLNTGVFTFSECIIRNTVNKLPALTIKPEAVIMDTMTFISCGIFQTRNTTIEDSTDISFNSATKTISSTSSDLSIFDSGDTIRVIGSTSNDGLYTVVSSTATTVVVEETLVTESAGATITIPSDAPPVLLESDSDQILENIGFYNCHYEGDNNWAEAIFYFDGVDITSFVVKGAHLSGRENVKYGFRLSGDGTSMKSSSFENITTLRLLNRTAGGAMFRLESGAELSPDYPLVLGPHAPIGASTLNLSMDGTPGETEFYDWARSLIVDCIRHYDPPAGQSNLLLAPSGDTTPSVAGVHKLGIEETISITQFDDSYYGQVLDVFCLTGGSLTLVDGSFLDVGGSDITLIPGEFVRLYRTSSGEFKLFTHH